MKADLATALAEQMLVEHGLEKWRYRQDNARQRCGACHFAKYEITLSKHFIELNSASEVRATLLHEIAHALCGPGVGHGPRWQQVAARIGAPVETTNDTAVMPEPSWHLQCINCLTIVAKRHRRSMDLSRSRCRACGINDGKLRWLDDNGA